MSKKFEVFDGSKTYMFPNASIADKDAILRDFPAALVFPHIIETDEAGQVCFAVMNYGSLCSQYGVDPNTPIEDAIPILEEIVNAPPPAMGVDPMAQALQSLANVIAYDEAVAGMVAENNIALGILLGIDEEEENINE